MICTQIVRVFRVNMYSTASSVSLLEDLFLWDSFNYSYRVTCLDADDSFFNQVALGECDDIEKALNCVEQTLWTILETPKLKKLLDEKEGERKAKEEV